MKKPEFIELLKSHAKSAGPFRGRFVSYEDEDYWSYVRPAVDCFEPSIDLSRSGVVRYVQYGSKEEEYSYEDFAKKYFLI
jgi:hypothetical protein